MLILPTPFQIKCALEFPGRQLQSYTACQEMDTTCKLGFFYQDHKKIMSICCECGYFQFWSFKAWLQYFMCVCVREESETKHVHTHFVHVYFFYCIPCYIYILCAHMRRMVWKIQLFLTPNIDKQVSNTCLSYIFPDQFNLPFIVCHSVYIYIVLKPDHCTSQLFGCQRCLMHKLECSKLCSTPSSDTKY